MFNRADVDRQQDLGDSSSGTIEKEADAGTDGSTDDQQEPSNDYSESSIPDGGLQGWLQVVSGFLLYLNAW